VSVGWTGVINHLGEVLTSQHRSLTVAAR
jgi:hypothetical protein